MRVWGLTGGIATGKSTVARLFVEFGLPVIDADAIAREVVEPGQPGLREIAARFPGVVGPEGGLDRARLAERIFKDPTEREALNAITHPRIRAAALAKAHALAATGARHVIYDAPLLIENRLHEGLSGVILVVASPGVQRQRLMERDHLSAAQADARIEAQLPLEAKRPHATWIIDNDVPLAQTRAQVERIAREIIALPEG